MKHFGGIEKTEREQQIFEEVHSIIFRGHRIYPDTLSNGEILRLDNLRSECERSGRHTPEALSVGPGWCVVCGYFTQKC